MEIILAILGVMGVGIGVRKAYEKVGPDRRLEAVIAKDVPREQSEVQGCPAYGGWYFREAKTGSRDLGGTWDYRLRVQGILPDWLMMDWCARRAIYGSGSPDFLPEALFGAQSMSAVPEVYELFAEQGDLIVQCEASMAQEPPRADHPEVQAVARVLCASHAERGMQPFLQTLVLAVELQAQGEAMTLLVRYFPDHPETQALVVRALGHEVAAVRVAAALHPDVSGREVLNAAALDPELPASVRRDAIRGLAGAQDVLLAVAREAPQGVEDLLCEIMGDWANPRGQQVLLQNVDSPEFAIAYAAIDGLAKIGTRASLHALRRRLAGRPGEPLKSTLKVAIDLIVERSPKGEAGNLSLSQSESSGLPAGRVSMPPTSQD